jgi:lipopolysaccharide biosynthesis glycosyltransferase
MPLAVTARSILENLDRKRKLQLFIIDGGIEKSNKRKIQKSLNCDRCTIEWLKVSNSVVENLPLATGVSSHVSIASYYRLLIPELLPKDLPKAFYLDSDLIVDRDLGELWDIDMGENYLLAVQDPGTPYVSSQPFGLARYQELGIPADAKYFNAGVLAINLEKWRSDRIAGKIFEYLDRNRQYVRSHDQDGLNAVLAGKWGELNPCWNQQWAIFTYHSWQESPLSEAVYNEVINRPYIVHFSSVAKPWNTIDEHPFNHLFFRYLDLTAWKGWRLTKSRRLWRRVNRELIQFKKSFVQPKTTHSPLKAS